MSELQQYMQFKDCNVELRGTHDRPLFRATDIGKMLDLQNIRDVMQKVPAHQKDGVDSTDAIGRRQKMTFVTESGLYRMIMQSRKPEAEAFTDWVTEEVLPNIRKHGTYTLTNTLAIEQERTKQLQLRLESAEALAKREEEARLTAQAEARAGADMLARWQLQLEVERQKEKNMQRYPSDWELADVNWTKKPLEAADTFHLFRMFIQCGLYAVGGVCREVNLKKHFLEWAGLCKNKDIHAKAFRDAVEYCGGNFSESGTDAIWGLEKTKASPRDFRLER
jgi:prophage antirepressor-like protein